MYQSEELIPIQISKELNCTFVMDLLLLSDGSAYHYALINDLTKLVNFIRKRAPRDRNEICRNCFHTFASNDILRRHQEICYRQDGIEITMPGPDNGRHVFENFGERSFVPRIVYFDLESLIVPVAGPEPDNKNRTLTLSKNTRTVGMHSQL